MSRSKISAPQKNLRYGFLFLLHVQSKANSKQKNQTFIIGLPERYDVEACNERRVYLLDLTPGQHSFEETLQRWRAIDVSDLTAPGIESQIPRIYGDVLNHYASRPAKSSSYIIKIYWSILAKPFSTVRIGLYHQ